MDPAALWLSANNTWMYGELKDLDTIGEWGDLYDSLTKVAGYEWLSPLQCLFRPLQELVAA